MSPSSMQAAVLALTSQVVALVVGFGIMNSTQEGLVVAVTVGAVNVAFLIAHSIHANAKSKPPVVKAPAAKPAAAKPVVKS